MAAVTIDMGKWCCELPFLAVCVLGVAWGGLAYFAARPSKDPDVKAAAGCGFMCAIAGVVLLAVWAVLRFVL